MSVFQWHGTISLCICVSVSVSLSLSETLGQGRSSVLQYLGHVQLVIEAVVVLPPAQQRVVAAGRSRYSRESAAVFDTALLHLRVSYQPARERMKAMRGKKFRISREGGNERDDDGMSD